MLAAPLQTTPQEYRTAKGYRILIYLGGPPLVLLFLALPFLLANGNNAAPGYFIAGFAILGVGLSGFLAYGILETVKGRLVVQEQFVSQVGAFKTKTLAADEIKGFRADDKYTHIIPLNPQLPKLKIGHTTERYEEMQQWFASRYPDLNRVDLERATALLLEDHDLGRTSEERAEALAKATLAARTLNIAGGVVGAWLILFPTPYEWAILAGLLLPVLAAMALWFLPHSLRVDEKPNSGYPSVLIAILIPCLGLMLRALFDYELVSHAPMWPVVGATATGAALVLAMGSRQFLFRSGSVVSVGSTIVVLAFLYGYGASSIVNAVYDELPATEYSTQVLDKRISSGKRTSYYLKVAAWGPVATAEDVEVSSEYYDQIQPGQQVDIALHNGRLEVPWFTVIE